MSTFVKVFSFGANSSGRNPYVVRAFSGTIFERAFKVNTLLRASELGSLLELVYTTYRLKKDKNMFVEGFNGHVTFLSIYTMHFLNTDLYVRQLVVCT